MTAGCAIMVKVTVCFFLAGRRDHHVDNHCEVKKGYLKSIIWDNYI